MRSHLQPAYLPTPDSPSTRGGAQTCSTAPLRRHVEMLVDMAVHLPKHERYLMEQVWLHGLSAAEVARNIDRPSRSVQRQLARLVRRVSATEFQFVARHFDDLPPDIRPVAKLHILHGCSLRDTAQQTRLTLHRVRETVRVLKTMAASARFA